MTLASHVSVRLFPAPNDAESVTRRHQLIFLHEDLFPPCPAGSSRTRRLFHVLFLRSPDLNSTLESTHGFVDAEPTTVGVGMEKGPTTQAKETSSPPTRSVQSYQS